MTYTGRERRWMTSRAWSDWTDRLVHSCNELAREYERDASILLKLRNRAKNSATKDALWNGYWQLKERRDVSRQHIAESTAPWFDGSAFK